MSVQLLDKTRKINKLLHNNHSHKVVFNDICEDSSLEYSCHQQEGKGSRSGYLPGD